MQSASSAITTSTGVTSGYWPAASFNNQSYNSTATSDSKESVIAYSEQSTDSRVSLRHRYKILLRRFLRKFKSKGEDPDLTDISTSSAIAHFCFQPQVETSSDATVQSFSTRLSTSLTEQVATTMRAGSFRRQKKDSQIELLDETWEDWLSKYQKGDQNLSVISRPTCFCGFGHMSPPVHRMETQRLKAVNKVTDKSIWKPELGWINLALRHIIAEFRLKSACVSIIDSTIQQSMFEIGLGPRLETIGRELSLDSHTILSKNYFAILDASSDWRTKLNPLVHGPPFIKFYLGVPLMVDRLPVGCISVSDPYLKVKVLPELIEKLLEISAKLTARLELQILNKELTKFRPRIQWSSSEEELKPASNLFAPNEQNSKNYAKSEDSASEQCSTISVVSASSSGFPTYNLLTIQLPLYDFRLQPLTCKSVLQPFEIFESLLKCQTISQAIKKACRMVMQSVGADLVFVSEIRLVQSLLNSRREAKFEVEPRIQVRLVNNCAPNIEIDVEKLIQSDREILASSIASEYGISFQRNETIKSPMEVGIVMPFRRSQATPADNVLNTGGFVMGAYNSHHRTFSPGDKAFSKKVVRALDNILACNDEIAGLR